MRDGLGLFWGVTPPLAEDWGDLAVAQEGGETASGQGAGVATENGNVANL